MQTNEVGQYRVTALNPGLYTVQVETMGFKTQVQRGVVLEVAAVLEVDFTLELGAVSETVEVVGAPPMMQTQEASVGGVVTSTELARIPVNQRNYTRLILLMPGTSSRRSSQSRGTAESGTQLYSVNGGRPQDNSYTLDGIDSNMQMMNSPGISPPMDALQEFKVATNTGSDFGRSMGANVNMALKSGTRDLHGTAYWFVRNDVFDANEWFANRNGLGKTPFRLNQYGVALGGPVIIPKLYNGRDKMFWFFSWEGFRRRRGNTTLFNSPPQDFRNGDFSSLLPDEIITDPFNGGAPFPGNVMPSSSINPAVPTALDITTPLPNRPGVTQNVADNRSQANDRDAIHWRWDYAPTQKDNFFFRFSRQRATLLSPNSNPFYIRDGGFHVDNYGGTWNHIFNPTTVLEVRFGTNQPDNPGLTVTDRATRAEFLDATGLQMYQRDVFGDPMVNLNFGNYSITGGGGSTTGDVVYQTVGNLTLIKGKHNLKMGGQYHHRRFYTNTSNPMNGNATFNGLITGLPMADALLGYPTEIRRGQGNTLTDGIGHFMTAHIQDDWRVNNKLTINMGLTYQFGSRPYDSTDRLGNLSVGRDPETGEYFGELLWATTNPQPAPPDGERGLPAHRGGFGRALVKSDYNDFAPRIGLAYRLTDKTVIRSGFGVYYNSTFVQELQDLRKFWPFTVQQVFSPNRGELPTLAITDQGPSFESTAAIGGWPQNPENRSPYSMQWNFFIQQQILDDMTLEVGYVGSSSKKQIGYSPFNNALTPGPGDIQPRRLLTNFGDLDGGSNQYNGTYNSLQLKLNKRFSNGIMFNTNYTWQKALDGQSSLAEVKVQDPFNRHLDYSRSSWDVNHVFMFAGVYELPFGKGRKYGSGWSTAADAIAGGWSLEGIMRLETGPPILVRSGQDIANTGRSTQRMNLVGDPDTGPRTVDQWFNTSAFAVPDQYTFGTAGQYINNGDGVTSVDIAVQKQFIIREGHQIEFRAEFFNMPNHPNFNKPQGRANRSDFGVISGTNGEPRQIQFALRYRF